MIKCDKKQSFHECELSILRNAVDKIETIDREKNSKIIKSFFTVNKYQKQLERIFN